MTLTKVYDLERLAGKSKHSETLMVEIFGFNEKFFYHKSTIEGKIIALINRKNEWDTFTDYRWCFLEGCGVNRTCCWFRLRLFFWKMDCYLKGFFDEQTRLYRRCYEKMVSYWIAQLYPIYICQKTGIKKLWKFGIIEYLAYYIRN